MQMPRRQMVAAVTAVCLTATISACGGGTKDNASSTTTHSSSSSTSASATSTKAAAPSGKLQPRNLDTAGSGAANPTIADYIREQHITETPMHEGDPGAPRIDIQLPDGWQGAGADTPDYAYGALVYTGPEAQGANYTPNIIALAFQARRSCRSGQTLAASWW